MTEVRIPEGLWDSRKTPEAVVVNWFYRDGATVEAGAPLLEIMVEKTQLEITAPASGRLTILARPETVVTVGAVIAEIA